MDAEKPAWHLLPVCPAAWLACTSSIGTSHARQVHDTASMVDAGTLASIALESLYHTFVASSE